MHVGAWPRSTAIIPTVDRGDKISVGPVQREGDIREALELHADGQPALQLSQHVRRFTGVEGAAADEQDVVRRHIPVLGADHRALDDGQEISLHTL